MIGPILVPGLLGGLSCPLGAAERLCIDRDGPKSNADTLAALIADHRDPSHITHTVADILRARMLAIGCGYPDGNDFDRLRFDPAFKLACGRAERTSVPAKTDLQIMRPRA